ncbi:MAG: ABC transporter substrate-binding protein [Arthrobacter sp.]|nr:ABC transporter substrate-binding protein [Arthrobacter sp.]
MIKALLGMRLGAMTAALTLLALTGCASTGSGEAGSEPKKHEKIKVASLSAAADVPLYIALENGYFTEAGLDVELVPVKSSADIPALLVSGGVQFGTGQPNATFFNAAASGIKDPVIMATNVYSPDTKVPGLVVRKDLADAGKGPGDLAGANLAIVGPSTSSEYFAKSAIKEAGGDPAATQYAVMGLPDMLSALSNNKVDAAWMFEPLASVAVSKGIAVNATGVGKVAAGFPTWLQASEKIVKSDPEAVTAFAAATLRALEFYDDALANGKRDDVVKILTKYTSMTEAADWAKVELPTVKTDGLFDEKAVDAFQEYLVAGKVTEKVIPSGEYVDDTFRAKARAALNDSKK